MIGRRRAGAAALALFAAIGARLAAAPFSLGAENAAGPWGGPEGRGCGNDLVLAAFRAVGAEARLEILPYARAKKMLLDGSLDGCFGMAWAPEFAGKVDFSAEPLYRVTPTVFVRVGAEKIPTGLSSLRAGSSLGIVIDYEYPAEIAELGKRGIQLVRANSEANLLKMLAAGRVDAALCMLDPLKSLGYLETSSGTTGSVVAAFSLSPMGTYVGFAAKGPVGRAAREAFDRGFAILKAKGDYERIVAGWAAALAAGRQGDSAP